MAEMHRAWSLVPEPEKDVYRQRAIASEVPEMDEHLEPTLRRKAKDSILCDIAKSVSWFEHSSSYVFNCVPE